MREPAELGNSSRQQVSRRGKAEQSPHGLPPRTRHSGGLFMSRRNRSFFHNSLNPIARAVAAALPGSKRSTENWRRTSLLGISAMLLPAFAVAQDATNTTAQTT